MALAPGQVRDLSPAVVRRYFGDYTLVRGGTATPFPRIVRFGTHGDGTCFFHSVCAALNMDGYLERSLKERQKIGHDFRCRFTDHLTSERWARFLRQTNAGTTYDKKDVDVARKAFCTTREWADEQMIRWTSVVLRKNIIFIDQSNRRIYCGVRGDPEKQDTIVIMWIAKSHFEPLGVLYDHDERGKRVQLQLLFDAEQDRGFVDAIMSQYEAQCAATDF